jgi:hypothetical protein
LVVKLNRPPSTCPYSAAKFAVCIENSPIVSTDAAATVLVQTVSFELVTRS